jgi:hypothetical protein
MANVVTNPTADQQITLHNLLASNGNMTQSLGTPSAPWNLFVNQLNGGTVICLTGSTDPYQGLISNAISALPSSGGTIDARAAGVSAVAQGNIDPGTTPVVILLGPGNYTVTSITVRSGLRIHGVGRSASIIQCSAATNVALFLGPGITSAGAVGCYFSDFACYGPAGGSSTPTTPNYLDCFGFNCDGAPSYNNGAILYSVFERIYCAGFGGNNWHFRGASTSGSSSNQFISLFDCDSYTNVGPGVVNAAAISGLTLSAAANASGGATVYTGTITGGTSNAYLGFQFVIVGFDNSANNGTFICTASSSTTLTLNNPNGVADSHAATATGVSMGSALRIEGANYQISCHNCDFEGPYSNHSIDSTSGTSPLVFVGGGPGPNTAAAPYIIVFDSATTIQGREVAVHIDGAQHITFQNVHMEQNHGCFLITYGSNGAGIVTAGVFINACSFNGNTGTNSGSGYIVNVNTSTAQLIAVQNCVYLSGSTIPDSWLTGTPGMTGVTLLNNMQTDGSTVLWPSSPVVAKLDLTAQSASIGATTMYTIPAWGAGTYRISGSLTITTAGTAGTATWGVAYTNRHGSASQNPASSSAPLSSIGYEVFATVTVYCAASSAIQYMATLSGSSGNPRYALDLRIEYLG